MWIDCFWNFVYPISEITDLTMNYLSRKFEYQADNYAKSTYGPMPLVVSLKNCPPEQLEQPHTTSAVCFHALFPIPHWLMNSKFASIELEQLLLPSFG